MASDISIKSSDGFELGCYSAVPEGDAKAAVVVIQEIFGVNSHIRDVADRYAQNGYRAYAPMLFDRISVGIELGYEEADMGRGIDLAFNQLDLSLVLQDVQATITHAASEGKVGLVGFCFGGLVSWLSAAQLSGLSAVVGYYGGGIAGQLDKKPQCPTMLHFGELDAHIPMSDVESIQSANPQLPVHVYAADHGFNCDQRGSYNAEAAGLAQSRTLEFFAHHLVNE